ncbi:GNAT family N-acetyltransferase [bacterium]|nr:GNAT family N-acetyltransferase [bacterium]
MSAIEPTHNIGTFSLHSLTELTEKQKSALNVLSINVYPPNEIADWKGKSIEWASPQWCSICWDYDEQALSYVGAIIRIAMMNDVKVKIGGIGGVKTHTSARKLGLASQTIEKTLDFFKEQRVDFALLVCESNLVPLYERMGWQTYEGEVLVSQKGKIDKFTFNLPMLKSVCSPVPMGGVINLMGPPW